MTASVRFWSHLAHFFLEREMLHTGDVKKIETYILCRVTFFFGNPAVCAIIWKKCGGVGEATDVNITRRMRFTCWLI